MQIRSTSLGRYWLPRKKEAAALYFCFLLVLDTFMAEEIAEFEIGKRHLANIMGADPDTFSQEDINVS